MIIAISGLPGAGKGTLAKKLSAAYDWPLFGMGDLRRRAAAERGLTLAEYNRLGETDSTTDLTIDNYQKELGQTKDNFIIDGRTSWYFIPQAVKIFLTVEPAVGAERIWQHLQTENQQRNEDKNLASPADVLASNQQRLASDRQRYQKYWQIDVYDPSHYDLVIDTTKLTPDQVFSQVQDFVAKHRKI